jgi:hypothetical protein
VLQQQRLAGTALTAARPVCLHHGSTVSVCCGGPSTREEQCLQQWQTATRCGCGGRVYRRRFVHALISFAAAREHTRRCSAIPTHFWLPLLGVTSPHQLQVGRHTPSLPPIIHPDARVPCWPPAYQMPSVRVGSTRMLAGVIAEWGLTRGALSLAQPP